MSILTDLRAALEAKREAEAALDLLHKPGTSGFDEVSWKRAYYRLKHLEDDLHKLLTDDTIRALIDAVKVAGSGLEEIGDCEETWHCADGCCTTFSMRHESLHQKLHTALAPLVKEATDE